MPSNGLKPPSFGSDSAENLQHVRSVSDSDDDLGSPECYLSLQPIKEDYSSDDEVTATKKEGMLSAPGASDDYISEMTMYYLGITYCSHQSDREVSAISAQDLFTESLRFYFPGGLPKSYAARYNLPPGASWNEVGSQLFRSFIAESNNDWLRRNYTTDFSKVTADNVSCVNRKARQLWKFWMGEKNFGHVNAKAFHLANRFHKVLADLYEGRESEQNEDDDDKDETCEKMRGLLKEIASYLTIPNILGGEGRVDFRHRIKDGVGSLLSFTVTPDLTLCSATSLGAPQPFAVIQVTGTSVSTSHSLQNTKTTSTDGPPTHQGLVDLGLLDQGLADQGVANQGPQHEGLMKQGLVHQRHIDKFKLLRTENDCTSIYNDDSKKKAIRDHMTSCGPAACSAEANKLYVHMALQMYGALIQKATSVTQAQLTHGLVHDPEANLQVAGFFVVNDCIYLAKSNTIFKFLSKDHVEGSDKSNIPGPEVTYAKKLYFDLKRPKHRLAFLALLNHCYDIHETEERWKWKEIDE